MTLSTPQSFIEHLSIPKACELNKPVFKKLFLENGVLDAVDKAALRDDVDKVRWLYTLKPRTINIPAYTDAQRDYGEIAVLQIDLIAPKRFKRIAAFTQKSIPYPLVLIFTHGNSLCISMADKRINQADKEKWVIEDSLHTDWINLAEPSAAQSEFLMDCTINNFSFANYLSFYKSLSERVIALSCAAYNGRYALGRDDVLGDGAGSSRLECLREIEKLSARKAELASVLKRERQMARQIELNTQIKQINDKIEQIKEKI